MNPETYEWYQCDEEDYNSNDSLEEQAETAVARAWNELQIVPSYCERFRDGVSDDDQVSLDQRPAANFYCRGCERWEYRSPALMAKYRK